MTLQAAGAEAVSGTIYDVSASGIALVVDDEIAAGTLVQIEGVGFSGHGVVRYCRQHGPSYRLGVALEPTP